MVSCTDATIRILDTRDFEALSQFFSKNDIHEVTKHFHPFPLNEESALRITNTVHLDRYYGAFLESQLIGFCMLRGWDEGFQTPSFGILVDVDYRNHGLGGRLLDFALREAFRLRCPSVRLSVFTGNAVAIRLYQSKGFREITRQPCKIARDEGDKLIMEKRFDLASATWPM
jgi:RimJ/RimL family protein N-acetyltransferase